MFSNHFLLVLIYFHSETLFLLIFVMLFDDQIEYFIFNFLVGATRINLKYNSFGYLLELVQKIEYIDNQRLNAALPINIFLFNFDVLS